MKLNIQLFADGKVVIQTELDTKSFQAQISQLEDKLDTLTKEYEVALKDADFPEEELQKYQVEIEKTSNKIQDLTDKQEQLDKIDLKNIKNLSKLDFKGVNNGLRDILRKVAKWGLAVFGIRGAYMAVRNAMNTITQQDKQLANDIQFMKTALAYTLEPIIRAIVNLMKYLVAYVGYVVKLLTGRDIFAQASKNLKSGAKSAQQIEKSLSVFDEANIINKSSGGGADSGISNYSFDAESILNNWNLDNFIEKGKELAKKIAKGVNDFFAKTDWSKLADYITLALSGIIAIVDTFLTNIDWTLIGQSIATFILSINWYKLGKDIIKLIVDGLIGALNLFRGVTDGIVKKFKEPEFRQKLVDGGKEMIKALAEGMTDIEAPLQTVWSDIISWFLKKLGIKNNEANQIGDKIGEVMVDGLKNSFFATHPIANVFLKLIDVVRNIFGIHSPSKVMEDIGKNLADGLKKGIEEKINNIKQPILAVVNAIIKGINKLIDGINKINISIPDWVPTYGGKKVGFNIKKIPEVKLAKGGIVNMPGRGVPVGAMAGERGMEGIIPLTDSQQMAMLGEAIGRYITINANIPVNMNGRLISREIRKVQNDNSFATNGGAY